LDEPVRILLDEKGWITKGVQIICEVWGKEVVPLLMKFWNSKSFPLIVDGIAEAKLSLSPSERESLWSDCCKLWKGTSEDRNTAMNALLRLTPLEDLSPKTCSDTVASVLRWGGSHLPKELVAKADRITTLPATANFALVDDAIRDKRPSWFFEVALSHLSSGKTMDQSYVEKLVASEQWQALAEERYTWLKEAHPLTIACILYEESKNKEAKEVKEVKYHQDLKLTCELRNKLESGFILGFSRFVHVPWFMDNVVLHDSFFKPNKLATWYGPRRSSGFGLWLRASYERHTGRPATTMGIDGARLLKWLKEFAESDNWLPKEELTWVLQAAIHTNPSERVVEVVTLLVKSPSCQWKDMLEEFLVKQGSSDTETCPASKKQRSE
jgi:hypothetical protein